MGRMLTVSQSERESRTAKPQEGLEGWKLQARTEEKSLQEAAVRMTWFQLQLVL